MGQRVTGIALACLGIVSVSCGGGAKDGETAGATKAEPASATAPAQTKTPPAADADAGVADVDDGDEAAGDPAGAPADAAGGDAAGAEPAGDEGGDPAGEAGDAGPAEDDAGEAADAGEAGDAAGGEAVPDAAALLKEVKSKKTKDDRAEAALAEAEAAGASVRDLAVAAKARGDALFAEPERAAKFYTWAAEKDPKYPDATFALAKQEAVLGNVDEVKKLLAEVKARGGKKLLGQVEFDPMWEIVKDDPDVQALLH